MRSKSKQCWISDIKEGLGINYTPVYYNDINKRYRRIKFFFRPLTLKEMVHLKEFIQNRRREYDVEVLEWKQTVCHHCEYCVYYKAKTLELSAAA